MEQNPSLANVDPNPFLIYLIGLSIRTLNYCLNELNGLAYNLVFINVNGDSNIIAMYLAETALKEYLKNLFINGISDQIFRLNVYIKFVYIVKPYA